MNNSSSPTFLDFDDENSICSLIDSAFLPKESYEIEYKSAKEGFPMKEFWKTYSAFANTHTGFIILGIKEKKDGLLIEGLTDEAIESYQKTFWNNCNNPNTINTNLLSNSDVRTLQIAGKKVLVFKVPFATRTQRPIYLTPNPFGNTYKRNNEGDYHCTDDEVRQMIADATGELRRDSLILECFTTEDFDPTSVRQFRQLFSVFNASHPWNALSDIELFTKIGAYRKDRKTGKEGITLAGLLMFGKGDSLNQQEALPNFFPEYREHLSEAIRWTDRIYPDGTWEHNLLQFYLRVLPKITSVLPKPFHLEKDTRIEETSAHIALREAFVNALVHTDYSQSGNIIVTLEKQQFIISNPGTLLVSLDQYYEGGISECRNPSLQKMFMLIGRAEKSGSGVDKIMRGWDDLHWSKPYLKLEEQPNRVKLILPMFHILPEQVMANLQEQFPTIGELTTNELTALTFCSVEGCISNNRLQYILKLHPTDITYLLKGLVERGYLESDNKRRWANYHIKGKKVATSSQKVATSSQKVATSSQKVATSIQKVATSKSKKVATSSQKVDTSSEKVDTSYPKKNLRKKDLEEEILKLCKDRFRKKEELASLLGKSENYLKDKFIYRMQREGKLEPYFPLTPNHPEQAYKTTEFYQKHLTEE